MPRDPVTKRKVLYDRLDDDTFILLDMCLVTTSLGDMVETVPVAFVNAPTGGAIRILEDQSFDTFVQVARTSMLDTYNTSLMQLPSKQALEPED